jgi:hypothetical protein
MESLGLPWIPFADSGLFNGLRRIQTIFSFSRGLRLRYAPEAWPARRLAVSIAAAGLIHMRGIVLAISVFGKELSQKVRRPCYAARGAPLLR